MLGATQNGCGRPLQPDEVADGLKEKDLSGKAKVDEENTGPEEKNTHLSCRRHDTPFKHHEFLMWVMFSSDKHK